MITKLPVEAILPQLSEVLAAGHNLVLQAPPGAGKTTLVPLALLDADWLAGLKILLLEPRRVAARAAARRMASLLDESVGERVGYRIRNETRVGTNTRIEVVTEGVLTRILQSDPELSGVGLIIFDEFHERSLHADLGLALALESQSALNESLRLLVMSATLQGLALQALLPNCVALHSEGRSYPVEVRYRPPPRDDLAYRAEFVGPLLLQLLAEEAGSVLVFLPGVGEIRQLHAWLQARLDDPAIQLFPLYGDLSPAEQDHAIAPCMAGERKLVLATTLAESSLTIDGVRLVVDCGYKRAPRFEPRSGMSRLATVRLSKASAEQRLGRAGRLEPGICYRLWSQEQQGRLLPQDGAEILQADLASLVLELAQWGASDPNELNWLDSPPEAAFAQGRELLCELRALDSKGRITAHGEQMLRLGAHPRLAHLLIRGVELGLGGLACCIAALLAERDLLAGEREVALAPRLRLLGEVLSQKRARGRWFDIVRVARLWAKALKVELSVESHERSGELLALAYPDRLAQRRDSQRGGYRLRNGNGARLSEESSLLGEPYLAVASLSAGQGEAWLQIAAPLSESALEALFAEQIETEELVRWSPRQQQIEAVSLRRLGALELERRPLIDSDPGAVSAALMEGIRALGLERLPWSQEAQVLRERLNFLHRVDPQEWPDCSDSALLANLEQWLGPYLHGIGRIEGLKRLELKGALLALLSWEQQQALERLAPERFQVPSDSQIRIDYSVDPPVLAVRIQELFGLLETPRIANGKVALKVHLLSPASRPVQVTQDLTGFWASTYQEVKKDLKGRYPKHYWPDDPFQAEAIRGVRRSKS